MIGKSFYVDLSSLAGSVETFNQQKSLKFLK